jgi:predicted transposase YbfD/YdcC
VERQTFTWDIPGKLRKKSFWNTFKTLIRTERTTHKSDGSSVLEIVFHVSTAPITAAFAAGLIRSHWSIENTWHGLRDMGFYEDASQATGLTARGLSLLRTWTINLAHSRKARLTKAQREFWRDPKALFSWAAMNI